LPGIKTPVAMDGFPRDFPLYHALRIACSGGPHRIAVAMVDTLGVLRARFILWVFPALAAAGWCRAQPATSWPEAVAHASRSAPQARILVVDTASGRLLAASHLAQSAHTLAAPGSTLKPLAMYGLVAEGHWDPARRIACTRRLTVASRSLNCSHPAAEPMDARQALAWSCNTYFAAVGATLGRGLLRGLLAPSGLLGQTGLAGSEAVADFHEPRTADDNRLALLGVEGVRVTPLELAQAYRRPTRGASRGICGAGGARRTERLSQFWNGWRCFDGRRLRCWEDGNGEPGGRNPVPRVVCWLGSGRAAAGDCDGLFA